MKTATMEKMIWLVDFFLLGAVVFGCGPFFFFWAIGLFSCFG